MDLIADTIAGLSLLLAGYVFWQQRQDQKRRAEWEHRQVDAQRHQWLEGSQPVLRAVGSSLRYALQRPYRLAADAPDQEVELQNVGHSMPRDVRAVLFMPEARITLNSSPPRQVPGPANPYWQGSLAASIAPGTQIRVSLTPARAPLRGDQRIGHQTLFPPAAPPPQPDPGLGAAPTGATSPRAGRLTVTYRDQTGRKLAGTFDLDADTGEWTSVEFQPEIDRDLVDLTDATE